MIPTAEERRRASDPKLTLELENIALAMTAADQAGQQFVLVSGALSPGAQSSLSALGYRVVVHEVEQWPGAVKVGLSCISWSTELEAHEFRFMF